MSRSKLYTLEFKRSAAKVAVESEHSVVQTARDLGVNENTLHSWIRAYIPRPSVNSTQSPNVDMYEEMGRLKKENIRLRQERDILRKATAYLAKAAELEA